ncbi:MAG TPA: type II secretion system F family protein [Candidatus Acidoferrales bacterium]|nr:type II secretion system F family protein [Candidatus Acidoferrales bacterium]
MILTPGQLNRRAELYHQLGSMIAAGVPLMQALEMAGKNSSLRASRKYLSTLLEQLRNGRSLSDAMQHVHGWLPDFDAALLAAGEHSGKLDYSFKRLGEYYATKAQIIRETISSLAIAALNLHVFLFIFPLSVLIKFAIGLLNSDYRMCIPFIKEKIIVYGALWGVILFFIFACQGRRGEPWRAMLEYLHQLVPMLRTALKYLVLYRFTTALEALVNSGISILKGLPMAAAGSGSTHLKNKVAEWPRELEAGTTPSELIRGLSYFPDMYANLYYTGEISGRLDDSLVRLQTYYHEEGFRLLRLFMRILSRTIYLLIALLIAYNVIGFYTGYFQGVVNGAGGGGGAD